MNYQTFMIIKLFGIQYCFQAVFILIVLLLPAYSAASNSVKLIDEMSFYPLARYIEIFEDRDNYFTIEMVSEKKTIPSLFRSTNGIINFSITDSTMWIRFRVVNNTLDNRKFLLELAYTPIDYATLYTPESGNTFSAITLGDLVPIENRLIRNRKPLFPLFIEPGSSVRYYMKFETQSPMQITLNVWKPLAFFENDHNEQILYGLFFGIMLVMAFYNLFLFFSLRDKTYLAYFSFVISFLLWGMTNYGFMYEYIITWNPMIANLSTLIFLFLALISATVFTKLFLKTAEYMPVFNRIFNSFIFLFFIGLVASVILDFKYGIMMAELGNAVLSVMAIISATISLLRGYTPARFYLIAWALFLAGCLIYTLKDLTVIPNVWMTRNLIIIGNIFEVVLLSFALGDRINILRREKDKAIADSMRLQIESKNALEQKVIERTRELNDACEKLKELDVLKTEFFANISHELRTPLSFIITPIQAALDGTYGNQIDRDFLEMINWNGVHLLELINNLLDFSKIDAGRMSLKVGIINIAQMIQYHASAVKTACDIEGIKLEILIDNDDVYLYMDPEKTYRILSNMFSNSLKFTDSGGIITVRLQTMDSKCIIEFEDTGVGIPEKNISSIFERFSQAAPLSIQNFNSTGIGLALVRELLSLHGGDITVVSRCIVSHPNDHGTIFSISIPKGKEHLKDKPGVEISDIEISCISNEKFLAIPGKNPLLKSKDVYNGIYNYTNEPVILVVEDNREMHELLDAILCNEFRLIHVCNGNEALDVLRSMEKPPDLILADVMMIGMSGCELTRQVRVDPHYDSVPIILLTAYSDPAIKFEGFEGGATDFITKPFNARELICRLQAQISMKKVRDKLDSVNQELYRELQKRAEKSNNVSASAEEKIAHIIDFINENYKADLSREGMASAVDLSPDYLSRVFNKITGLKIPEYINRLRIREAARRLVESDVTILCIAYDVGFNNLRTFNRAFLKLMESTPSEYRKNNF